MCTSIVKKLQHVPDFLYFCDISGVISSFSLHSKIYIYLFHDFPWNYIGKTLASSIQKDSFF